MELIHDDFGPIWMGFRKAVASLMTHSRLSLRIYISKIT